MRATVCLCDRDTCNGPSLPPREIIEDEHDIIDIEEVIKEMNEEPREVQPEAVSSKAGRRTLHSDRDFVTTSLLVLAVILRLGGSERE